MTTRARASALTIIITPAGTGRYVARLADDDRVLCVSRTPFFEAARQLIADDYDPCTSLGMRHAGSETDCLQAGLGAAAAFTVVETDYGSKLRFWKPLPTLAGASQIAQMAPTALSLPDLSPHSALENVHA
jgi:hypothetical protein